MLNTLEYYARWAIPFVMAALFVLFAILTTTGALMFWHDARYFFAGSLLTFAIAFLLAAGLIRGLMHTLVKEEWGTSPAEYQHRE